MGLLRGTHRELSRRDKKLVGRTSPAVSIDVVGAQGSRIRDSDGRTFIDFQLGWGVGNLGWNPPDIVARVRSFDGPSYVPPNMLYEPWADLAEQLVDITPGRLAKVFRCVGGTESVELALELASVATGRHKFVALDGAYHGNSFAVRSITGDALDVHLPGCQQLEPPLDAAALGRLETLLKSHEIAAFIMEPTVTNLNVLIPDGQFMHGLVELCHDYGTLVIADEVACGWGRTGTLFACEHYELEPDLMCLAKSITGGVAPLGATLCTNDVANAVADSDANFDFYSSYGWHPLAVEAALATQQYWRQHKTQLLTAVSERSDELRHALSIMELPDQAELRIQGLAIAVDFKDADRVTRIEKRCRDHGLLVYAEDEAIVMFPPITIDDETTQEALGILTQAIGAG